MMKEVGNSPVVGHFDTIIPGSSGLLLECLVEGSQGSWEVGADAYDVVDLLWHFCTIEGSREAVCVRHRIRFPDLKL